jgi:hypothetical protein
MVRRGRSQRRVSVFGQVRGHTFWSLRALEMWVPLIRERRAENDRRGRTARAQDFGLEPAARSLQLAGQAGRRSRRVLRGAAEAGGPSGTAFVGRLAPRPHDVLRDDGRDGARQHGSWVSSEAQDTSDSMGRNVGSGHCDRRALRSRPGAEEAATGSAAARLDTALHLA